MRALIASSSSSIRLQPGFVVFRCVFWQVFQNGVAAKLPAKFGLDNKRVGLALLYAKLSDVCLNIFILVIIVVLVV
jgi:hypothetical protein